MSCWWRWGDGGVNYALILSQAESRSVCGAETSIHNCSREHSTWLVSLAFHRHSSYLESERSGPLSCHLFIYFNCKAQHCKKKKSWNAVKHKTDRDRLLFRLDGSLFLSGRFGVGRGGGGPDAILSGHRPLIDKLLTIITFWQSFSIQTIAASLEFTDWQSRKLTDQLQVLQITHVTPLSQSKPCTVLSAVYQTDTHSDEGRDQRQEKTALIKNIFNLSISMTLNP